MMLFNQGIKARNRARIVTIRDEASSAVEALARMFTDVEITDDGTLPGRLSAILAATEHRFVPGLHMGLPIGLTGFRKEFEDPWLSSTDQVGHFLTAVRLVYDPAFLSNPVFQLLLGRRYNDDLPVRLIVGHEKAPDPPDVNSLRVRTAFNVLKCFRLQVQSASSEDITNFRAGNLEAIRVGTGLGNSMADLRLSYKGWQFGHWMVTGRFGNTEETAHWIRVELGDN